MATSVLLSTLLTGILLLAIVVGLLRVREWERGPSVREAPDLIERAARSPTVWTAGFVLLALGFAVGVIAIVSVDTIPLPTGFWGLLFAFLAPFLLLLVLYVFAGVYASARDRGLSSAPAVGIASTVLGVLVLTAIVVRLFLDGGA